MKVKKIKNAINGEIDKNYQFTPGVRITLEAGTTFKGIDVGGQILYNDDRVVSTFTLDQFKELQLISCELVQEELTTTAHLSDASTTTLHTTLSPPPGEAQESPQTWWAAPRSFHATFNNTLKEQESSIQQFDILNEAPITAKAATDSTPLSGEGVQFAEETAIEYHCCGCILF